MGYEVDIGPFKVGGEQRHFLIAGPCVIESAQLALDTAQRIAEIARSLHIPYIFKSSYDQANRSSGTSFRGPGLKEGMAVLRKVKEEVAVPVLTDVHSVEEAERAAEVVDVLRPLSIPVAAVLAVPRMYADPQLNARAWFVELDHALAGSRRYPGWPMRFSFTDQHHRFGAPTLGQHNDEVLGGDDCDDSRAGGRTSLGAAGHYGIGLLVDAQGASKAHIGAQHADERRIARGSQLMWNPGRQAPVLSLRRERIRRRADRCVSGKAGRLDPGIGAGRVRADRQIAI